MDLPAKQRQFEDQYPALFAQTYRYVRYRVPHAQDAEDLVADAILRAYAKLDLFEPEKGNLSQWLNGFARHKVLTHWRDRRVTVSFEELEDVLSSPDQAPSEGVDQRLLAERLMAGLPQTVKALIAMRFIDGLTHEEIADATRKEPQAVRQFFSRLQRKLRLQAQELNDDAPSYVQ